MIKYLLWDPREILLPEPDWERRFLLCPIQTTLADCIQQTAGFSSDAAVLITRDPALAEQALSLDILVLTEGSSLEQQLADLEAEHMESWPLTLVQWYHKDHRDLPWRRTQDPYAVWISETMLQQTRVEAVISYYNLFMERFPTVQALAAAEIDEVLKCWEGLGYYSRARNLHKAAIQVTEEYGGRFPETAAELRALPGIGPYTAGAIASIAFGAAEPAVDGNVLRVLARLYALGDDILTDHTRKAITRLTGAHIPPQAASAFTQGLMELGALVCIPGHPRCDACPLQAECKAHMLGIEEQLPMRINKTKVRKEERTVYLIFHDHKVLLHRRPEGTLLGGLYEFPGVPAEDGQTFFETFGIRIGDERFLATAQHRFTHILWDMRIYESRMEQEDAPSGADWILADREQIGQIMLPSAFKKPLELAMQRLT